MSEANDMIWMNNGDPVDESLWAAGELNHHAGDCVYLNTATNRLYAGYCMRTMHPLCKLY